MGIKGFQSRMRPYGHIQRITQRPEEPISSSVAIIDGPSLAYAVFMKLDSVEDADDVIVAQWSYTDLGREAVAWIHQLADHGIKIGAIYFDGDLPPHKRSEREERLLKSKSRLQTLQKYHREAAKAMKSSGPNGKSKELLRTAKESQKTLAPPPFLVVAVQEALFESKYATRTLVVKGEADEFCAAAAAEASCSNKNNEPLIFSNDSDLLIYDVGERSRVVVIDEVELKSEGLGDDATVLHGLQFQPRKLAAMGKQSLTDLIRPAYEMDGTQTAFQQALKQSEVDKSGDEHFDKFAAQYSLLHTRSKLKKMRKSRKQGIFTMDADSRISELIYSGLREEDTTSDPDNESVYVDMYLPMLVEDPTRGSAWKIGEKYRWAAESLALRAGDCGNILRELASSSTGNLGLKYRIYHPIPDKELASTITSWTGLFDRYIQQNSELDTVNRWRFLIIRQVLSQMQTEQATLPDVDIIVNVIQGKAPKTWAQVHLSAQYQAQYYSIRMLKQVLEHLLPRTKFDEKLKQCGSLSSLSDFLEVLPGIAPFFDTTTNEVGQTKWQKRMEGFLRPFDSNSSKLAERPKSDINQTNGEQHEKSDTKAKQTLNDTSNEESNDSMEDSVDSDGDGDEDEDGAVGLNNPFAMLSTS